MFVKSFLLNPAGRADSGKNLAQELKEHRDLCVVLGFRAQLWLPDVMKNPVAYYPAILKDDWDRMQGFFFNRCLEVNWPKFRFGLIPPDALKCIAYTKKLRLFDELEIRTLENGADAVCIGVRRTGYRSTRRFLIVRWGEKEHSPDEMNECIRVRQARIKKIERASWLICAGFSAVGALSGAWAGICSGFPATVWPAMGFGLLLFGAVGWCMGKVYRQASFAKL